MYLFTEDFIAQRVDELCKTHGISKYRLAQKTGMTQTALARIINKECIPTIPTIEKICKAFDISLGQFFVEKSTSVDLNENQMEILNTWNNFNDEEKRIFLNIIRSIKSKN